MPANRLLAALLALAAFAVTTQSPALESRRVKGFLPSTCGFHFRNSWPEGMNHRYLNLITGAEETVPFTDAGNGLCGGMAFAVRDFFEARAFIPNDVAPPTTGPLYRFIVERLWDSFNLDNLPISAFPLPVIVPGVPEMPWQNSTPGIEKYLHLMRPDLPDHETWLNPLGHGRAWVMIKHEWPKIKADIDAGILSPIALVKVKSFAFWDIGKNHQVLAYGYELNGNDLTINIYDPNNLNDDNATLRLNIGSPKNTTEVSYTGFGKVYCFFRLDYSFNTPPQLTATPSEKSLLRSDSRPHIYVMQNGKRRWIVSEQDMVANGYLFSDVRTIPNDLLAPIPRGIPVGNHFVDGTLLQAEGKSEIYVIKNGRRCWITSPQAFNEQGHNWAYVEPIPEAVLNAIPAGPNIDALKRLGVSVEPNPVPLNKNISVRFAAKDSKSSALVTADVRVDGTKIGVTNTQLQHTFRSRSQRVRENIEGEWVWVSKVIVPVVDVAKEGYKPTIVDCGFEKQ
jgi:hypothetical protein